ncbi:uncharacterized protein LOC105192067 [Harpegnathos saltator]|uniref:uncharacterized protein LOC105192067 n=1 Tax=Harpegnathos saltator TaxID=610380 RepID=UPI000948EE61|nr:uncharacterized protein LOC105192067 [Harpegnathos saltator]XP_019701067.1 uncharacterized protein LOC105192067 [Harpegnathos saltator]XP_019701068.1 uncharacterized protein LOC105192067 [Harpegnathos saltator]
MGEGRSDRSGKRQRSSSTRGIGESSSDSEIARGKGGKGKARKSKVKERWPFLEGLTVDELARYRRRRVHDRPKDNLQPYPELSPVVIQDPASEYQRAFGMTVEEPSKENVWPIKGNESEDYPRVERTIEDARSSRRMALSEREAIEDRSVAKRTAPPHDHETMDASKFETSIKRSSPIRRGTSLKCGGDFYTDTETYTAYVPYEGQHRAELARRPTSLRMEGELDTMTEKCEKFIEWLNVSRPELMRIPTHLKMEGELETSTENHDKYVPFVGARRPELLRRSTNLKLEGDTYFLPEYTDVFRDYSIKDRLQPKKPQTHLKASGDFFQDTENTENFVHPRVKQAQQQAKLVRDDDNDEEDNRRMRSLERKEDRKKDEEMRMLVSKLEDLNGRPLDIPEYRDAYKDFPRERPKISKPDDEIGRADGSKVSSPSRSKFSTKIDQDPEYKSKYLEYPRDRPIYRKPPTMLRPTMATSPTRGSACFFNRIQPIHQECRAFEYEPISEVRSQYVPYGHVPRVETLKMPANLRPEGNIDLQPEYRNAYCARYDRQDGGLESRAYGRADRSPNASRRGENYWLNDNNNNDYQCDRTPQDQDAFRVLNTRILEDNVIGKPPPASRRSSKLSQATAPRLAQPTELTDRAVTRMRSPSPTYRLHVCDVDNEPRGFGQSARQSSERIRSPSADRISRNDVTRPYSPSFGRTDINRQDRRVDDQPFVVLDQALKTTSARRRNVDVAVPISRSRPRTPTRWMPPWYDNTNTI